MLIVGKASTTKKLLKASFLFIGSVLLLAAIVSFVKNLSMSDTEKAEMQRKREAVMAGTPTRKNPVEAGPPAASVAHADDSQTGFQWGWAFVSTGDQREATPKYFCFVYEDRAMGPSGKCVVLDDNTPDNKLKSLAETSSDPGMATVRLSGMKLKRLNDATRGKMGLPVEPTWAKVFRRPS